MVCGSSQRNASYIWKDNGNMRQRNEATEDSYEEIRKRNWTVSSDCLSVCL